MLVKVSRTKRRVSAYYQIRNVCTPVFRKVFPRKICR